MKILSRLWLFLLLAPSFMSSCVSPAHAQVQPYNLTVQQRNAADTGYVTRALATPANGANGLLYYNGTSQLPGYVVLGDGLTINSGILSATSNGGGAQADWNATSGPSSILNKPTLSTVGMTGQYGDLFGAPTAVSAFTNDAGYITNSALAPYALASSVSSLNSSLAPVAKSGSYNDLANKPTIPAAYVFNFGDPVSRTIAVSTAYQANDPTRAAIITTSASCTASLSLSAGGTCTLQVRTSATPTLTCSNGIVYATLTNANTGTLSVGLGLNQRIGAPISIHLRSLSYFILCPVSGTFTVDSTVDQPIG